MEIGTRFVTPLLAGMTLYSMRHTMSRDFRFLMPFLYDFEYRITILEFVRQPT